MYITKENERLYLRPLDYNMCRIMSALAVIVENHGGKVKLHKTALVSDRTIDDAEPIPVTHTTCITFSLDDVAYYFQIDTNPFFPFYYSKTPIINGKYSKDAMLEEISKDWLFDCLWSSGVCQADIVEIANMIFNQLCNAPNSEIYRNKKRVLVPNSYNDNYHYETVYESERFKKIDW